MMDGEVTLTQDILLRLRIFDIVGLHQKFFPEDFHRKYLVVFHFENLVDLLSVRTSPISSHISASSHC